MSTSTILLQTKLQIPPTQSELVCRGRLIECLNAGLAGKLTLVSAPAGSGKTTLLSQWARQRILPVGWLSLDDRDNDLRRFMVYVVAALQTANQHLSDAALDVLQSTPPQKDGADSPGLPTWVETILTTLTNELATQPTQIALVLDDYHTIRDSSIHQAIGLLLEHLPSQLHLLMATRSDPPLPTAQLRGRGQLNELRQADLQFTTEETAQFLRSTAGLALSDEDVASLAIRTEGWVAGLQMAAVTLRGRQNGSASAFIEDLSGSANFILDYLLEEVLQLQPPNLQAFLLRTAVLDRMNGPLCEAVCRFESDGSSLNGCTSGQATLEHLERTNLFVIPLDEHHHWYRYHHLFSSLLRQRLQLLFPDLIPTLHGRASRWYEQQGEIGQAIEHALAAEEFQRAAALVEQAVETTLMRSEVAAFLSWVEMLPPQLLGTHPRLCVYRAGLQLLSGHPVEVVERQLHAASEMDGGPGVAGEVAVFRALIAAYQGSKRRSAGLAQQALEQLPESSRFLRGLVVGLLGMAHLHGGDIRGARRALDEALIAGQRSGNMMVSVLALCHQAELSMLEGRLHEAQTYYQQALALSTDRDGRRLPIAGMAMMGQGGLLAERNQLADAARVLKEGIELIREWGEVGCLAGYLELAQVRLMQGQCTDACHLLRKARELATSFDAMQVDDLLVEARQVDLWLVQGNIQAAAHWAERCELGSNAGLSRLTVDLSRGPITLERMLQGRTLARVRYAQGMGESVLPLCDLLRPAAESAGWTAFTIEFLVLEALAHQAAGRDTLALAALEKALTLTESEGHVRVYVAGSEPMTRLLKKAASQGISPEQANRLLQAEHATPTRPAKAPQPLADPLSDRELEVLALIGLAMSNQEIADRLFIALSTVKSHINNIYRKLQVNGRMQAILRARQLSLI